MYVSTDNGHKGSIRESTKHEGDVTRLLVNKRETNNHQTCPERIDLLVLDENNSGNNENSCLTEVNSNTNSVNNFGNCISAHSLESELRSVRTILTNIYSTINVQQAKKNKHRMRHLQWRCVATVMDRLFFMIYLIAIGLSITILFPRPYV